MKINKDSFRKDLEDYFKLSGIFESSKLKHTPFIVLTEEGNGIELCDNVFDLIKKYRPSTEVISQWRGQWRSDFFYFTVFEVIEYKERIIDKKITENKQ